MSPDAFARKALDAVAKNKAIIVIPSSVLVETVLVYRSPFSFFGNGFGQEIVP
jgi:hypothetical protein